MRFHLVKFIIILVFLILPNLLRTLVSAITLSAQRNLSKRSIASVGSRESSLKRIKRDDDSESSEETYVVHYPDYPDYSTPLFDPRGLLWGLIFGGLGGRGAHHGRTHHTAGAATGGTATGGNKDQTEEAQPVIATPPEPGLPFFGGFPFDISDLFADEDSTSQFPTTAPVDVPPQPPFSRGSRWRPARNQPRQP